MSDIIEYTPARASTSVTTPSPTSAAASTPQRQRLLPRGAADGFCPLSSMVCSVPMPLAGAWPRRPEPEALQDPGDPRDPWDPWNP